MKIYHMVLSGLGVKIVAIVASLVAANTYGGPLLGMNHFPDWANNTLSNNNNLLLGDPSNFWEKLKTGANRVRKQHYRQHSVVQIFLWIIWPNFQTANGYCRCYVIKLAVKLSPHCANVKSSGFKWSEMPWCISWTVRG